MTRHIDRRNLLKGVGVAGVAGLAGCIGGNGNGNGNGNGGRTLKQGVLLPLSGDLANLGAPIRDGAILPAAELEGETDYTIDIQEEDTETNPQAGISGADALIDAGYPAITGAASSGVTMQVTQQSTIPNETVTVSPASTSPAITDLEDNGYVFRTCPSDALQGQVIAQVSSEELGGSTAATMYTNNDYGQALSQSFADTFENEYDGEVQNQVSFEQQQNSYTSQLESALGDEPDLLVVIGYPESGNQLFRDYYSDFDSGEDIVVTDGLIDDDLPDNVDNDMANVTATAPKSSGPGLEDFSELYQNEYDSEPGVFNAHAYDATAICLLANVYAGENNGAAVRDNMQKAANPEGEEFGPGELADAIEAAAAGDEINYQGASSATNFDDNGDMVAVSYGIYEVEDRDFTEVDSVDFGQ